MARTAATQIGFVFLSLVRRKRDIGAALLIRYLTDTRRPDVSLIVLGNEPGHVEGLGPWIKTLKLLFKGLTSNQAAYVGGCLHRMTNIVGERLGQRAAKR